MKLVKLVLLLATIISCAHISMTHYTTSYAHKHEAVELPNLDGMIDVSYRYVFEAQKKQVPATPINVYKPTPAELEALPNNKLSVIRFGHSTVLIKIKGQYWLTDPVFSDTLGPIYLMGVERFHDTPLSIAELPPIKGVLLSHNHYDHMDKYSIQKLRHKVERFYVPIGNGKYLEDWGIDPANITQLDWWEQVDVDGFNVIATPANHMSGRMFVDQNKALWSSWVLQSDTHSVFFSGDSGYSDIFTEIGKRYGPFDLTLLENGAYDTSWEREHLMPVQTVQAHIDLGGEVLMPIHNSTFDLAFHEWNEPIESVYQFAKARGIKLSTPAMGQAITFD